jgi:ApaG protein
MPNLSTSITEGIQVSVRTKFLPKESIIRHYVFAYQIEITNTSTDIVQLLSREWYITNGLSEKQVVSGEGVIGRQPIIAPGESYRYMSGTHFSTPIGKMNGFYYMRRFNDNQLLKIEIPVFVLATPNTLN